MKAGQRWTLVATILASAMTFIDGTVVNVALPALQADLHATIADVQWVVEAYTLFLSALILVGGAMGDQFGRKRVFLFGVVSFTAASIFCGIAPSPRILIIARALQGIGAGFLVPGSLSIISATFDDAGIPGAGGGRVRWGHTFCVGSSHRKTRTNMTTITTIEKELVDMERRYWQAIKDKNVNAAMELTDSSCVVAGASGVASIDRKAFAGMLNSSAWTLNEFEFVGDVQASLLTDDVAVVAYKVKEQLTVDGKPLTLEAADASTWVRRDGRWMCALHTEAIIGDAFGRDRDAR